MLSINLPIYYTQTFKTKKDSTFLVGMNWYRNAHYHIQNKVKHYYHELVPDINTNFDKYKLKIDLYYKNPNSDGANICSMMEKFVLDALQEYKTVENDSVKYHLGTTWEVIAQDKLDPRVEITIIPQ